MTKPMREFHDWRHTGITNAAAAGMSPFAIMRMAGHRDVKVTQRYIDLAGVLFGDEVKRLGEWYGRPGANFGCQVHSVEGRNPAVSSGNVPEAA